MGVVGALSQTATVSPKNIGNRQARKSTFVFALVPRDGSSIAIASVTTLRHQRIAR
jgi:hypothetical protein